MANITIYPFGLEGELPASVGVVDDLFTGGADKALSAEMGKLIGNELYRDGNVVQVLNMSQGTMLPVWFSADTWRTNLTNRETRIFARDERWVSLYVTANETYGAVIGQFSELPNPTYDEQPTSETGMISYHSIRKGTSGVIVLDENCTYIAIGISPGGLDFTPSYAAGCTTIEGGKSRLDVLEDEVNALIERPPVRLCQDLTFNRMGKIWDNTQAGNTSIYWPYIIRPVHANPLGKYYMYYSLDHGSNSDANVGIKLAYSNDLIHWTKYGIVLTAKDQLSLSGKKDTETPTVIWDAVNSRYLMYWHSDYDYGGTPYSQTTYISESVDGINWTYIKIALSIPIEQIYGNGHNGYFNVFNEDGIFYGYSLLGGGDDSAGATQISDDGLNWITMQESCGLSGGAGFRFCASGRYYLVKPRGQAASGSTANTTNLYIQEVASDYRTPIGDWVLLAEMDTSLGETTNIRSVGGFIDDGHIYILYNCATSNLSASMFFLAEIKVKED